MILINLDTIEKIKKFISVSYRLDYELNLISDRYIVDGKSIMGIFGLNLSKPVQVIIKDRQNYHPKELEEFMI